ncbi:MAG: hypothetical protein HZC02_03660 [Candidatus Levybacteria bacterium]|nr:hypothetical protein [Candidatus Levybacteria bacterium]
MRRRKRNIFYLIVGIIFLLLLIFFLITISPYDKITFFFFSIPALWIVPLPLLIAGYSLPTYFLKSKKHGIFFALFLLCYLLFRVLHLTHPLFIILLVGILLTLELFFTSKSV